MTALPYDGALAPTEPPPLVVPPPHTFHEETDMNSDSTDQSNTEYQSNTNSDESFPGFGSVPYSAPAAATAQTSAIEVQESRPKKSYSLVLLVSGLGAIAIALWVLFDTPTITPMIASITGLTLAVLFGLYLLTRK